MRSAVLHVIALAWYATVYIGSWATNSVRRKRGRESFIDVGRRFGQICRVPQRLRETAGGIVPDVLDLAVGRMTLFEKEADYLAFERVLEEAWERTGNRIRCVGVCVVSDRSAAAVGCNASYNSCVWNARVGFPDARGSCRRKCSGKMTPVPFSSKAT